MLHKSKTQKNRYTSKTKSKGLLSIFVGVWLHESGVLGASPAGIIRRADLRETMQLRPDILEVICPFTARNMTIPEAIYKEFCLCMHIICILIST